MLKWYLNLTYFRGVPRGENAITYLIHTRLLLGFSGSSPYVSQGTFKSFCANLTTHAARKNDFFWRQRLLPNVLFIPVTGHLTLILARKAWANPDRTTR